MFALDVADFEIEQRLEAFARARLSSDPATAARSRARIMREARLQFEAAQEAARLAPPVVVLHRRAFVRRLAMPALAASLWLGVAVGTVAASQAGGPLYPTRLWIENATLPAAAGDRTRAEIARLDERLADAMSAAARGDTPAVAAALDAYGRIADDASAASVGDETLEASVAAALDRHRAVLAAVVASLAGRGDTIASAAVQAVVDRVIAHNLAVIDRLGETGKPAGSGGGSAGGSNGTAGSGSGAGSGGSAGSGSGAGSGGSTGSGGGAATGAGPGTGGSGAGNGQGAGSGAAGGNGGAGGSGSGSGGSGSGSGGGGSQGDGGPVKGPQASHAPAGPGDEPGGGH